MNSGYPYVPALKGVTQEIYESLKTAVSLGRWPNGEKLTSLQKENSLQLIIAYEAQHVPNELRVGYFKRPGCKSE